ncbi:MAG TPA: AMP-binding protein [Acidimicrobiales bacterium]|nr:AMP-binding protein [Acidimicrobiales bacterium]
MDLDVTAAPVPPLQGTFATVDEAMDAAAEQFGDREAYVDGDRRWTFAEWIAAADALAAGLAARGVRPGDVVALMLPPSIDYAVAYAAALRVGAVATGLNTRLGAREVDAIIQRCQPAVVVRDASLGLPAVPGATPVIDRSELARLVSGPGLGGGRPARRPEDPVVIIWTSGTTGLPKGAWFDHRALAAAVATAGVLAAPFDRRLVTTPFAHAGYMAKLWEQLAWGIAVVISPPPWTAEDMIRLVAAERITVTGGVPTQWAKVVEHPALDTADTSSLRLCVSATAPAPPELVERVHRRLGCPIVVRYAMTESPSITGTDPGEAPDVLYRTVGKPQAGVDLELRDDEGRRVPDGEVGRVHVRSRCAMRGYWRDEERTAEAFTPDGWLRSGDLGRLDGAGNLVLVGRTSDLYIRGGYNVYPLEVENVLAEHPAVAQASIVGVPAPVIGEIGVAFVVPADPAAPPSDVALRAWCRERLADYKAPDELVLVEALPLTPMLKVDKLALARLARG